MAVGGGGGGCKGIKTGLPSPGLSELTAMKVKPICYYRVTAVVLLSE